jgi:AraC-like DNA-binding protein
MGRSSAGIVVKSVVDAAEALGAPVDRLLGVLLVRREDLERYDLRVPYHAVAALWRELVAWSRDPMIGARLAEQAGGSGRGGLFEYTVRSAPSIDVAWARLAPLLPLIFGGGDDLQIITRAAPGGWEIGYRLPPHSEPPIAPSEEMLVLSFTAVCRQIAPAFEPLAIRFMHRATVSPLDWRHATGCAVEFEAPCNGLLLSERSYRAPIDSHDPQLAGVLAQLARPLVAEAPPPDGPVDAVVRVLRDRLDRGAPVTLADVAAALHVSERTLQRQLAAAGTTLRAELDGVRRTIALARLRDQRCSVAEIAAALGFADPAQLSRAVRRWTGMPPSAIRAQSRTPHPSG